MASWLSGIDMFVGVLIAVRFCYTHSFILLLRVSFIGNELVLPFPPYHHPTCSSPFALLPKYPNCNSIA